MGSLGDFNPQKPWGQVKALRGLVLQLQELCRVSLDATCISSLYVTVDVAGGISEACITLENVCICRYSDRVDLYEIPGQCACSFCCSVTVHVSTSPSLLSSEHVVTALLTTAISTLVSIGRCRDSLASTRS